MISESKPLPAEVLKETYVLIQEARILWDALRLYDRSVEPIPDELLEMIESRLSHVYQALEDVVNPLPF